MRVYVLLITTEDGSEGIHTVKEAGKYRVLMFECEDDATRYALLLEAQDFPTPSVEAIDSDEIEDFCREAGYEVELVREGETAPAMPPPTNVDLDDWQQQDLPSGTTESEAGSEAATPDIDLDDIRRRLERLL